MKVSARIGKFLLALAVFAITCLANGDVNENWVVRYDGGGSDVVRAMTLDRDGNLIVTGRSLDPRDDVGVEIPSDFATVKYDGAGNQIWSIRSDRGLYDDPRDLAVDAEGNIFVTGSTGTDRYGAGGTYVTVKYDEAGNELWASIYTSGSGLGDFAYALALDEEGAVYVAGYTDFDTFVPGMSDYGVVKYDAVGNELWIRRYDNGNDDWAQDASVDADGNVYVTGWSDDEVSNRDFATVKYDGDGNELWVRRFDGRSDSAEYTYDSGRRLALDTQGNVYVAGWSGLGRYTPMDYAVVKYDADGNELWVRRYDGGGDDRVEALVVDVDGNAYVGGLSYDVVAENDDYAVVKYDSAGNELWVSRYDHGGNDRLYGLAVDAEGNVFATGYSEEQEAEGDYATVAFDPTGEPLWEHRYDYGADDSAIAVALDREGSVFVTGRSVDPETGFSDYATIKYLPVEDEGETPDDGDDDGGGGGSVDFATLFVLLLSWTIYRKKRNHVRL